MHQYTSQDMQACFGGAITPGQEWFQESLHYGGIGNPVLMGDSTIRRMFWAVARKLDHFKAMAEEAHTDQHADVNFTTAKAPGITLHFLWKPLLQDIASTQLWSDLEVTANSTENSTSYARTSAHPFLPFYDSMIAGSSSWQPGRSYTLPKSLVVGVPGLWHAKNGDTIDKYLEDFTSISSFLEKHIVVPIQQPWFRYLSDDRKNITAYKVEAMQKAVHRLPQQTKVLWAMNEMLRGQSGAYESDGLHVIDVVADAQADVLLNTLCNEHLATFKENGRSAVSSSDYSCCNNYVSVWNTATAMIAIIAVSFCSVLQIMPRLGSHLNNRVLCAASTLILAVMVCMLADRSPLFVKVNKRFRLDHFLAPWVAALVVGVASIRRVPSKSDALTPEPVIAPVHQTDEWKGWMQVIILLYHYTGASKILWAYQLARILVASYLFMTGYGHTRYFLQTQDFSLRRVALVLLRLNMLTCLLPYAMSTTYLFYYFPPLASFWFLVVYLSIRMMSSLEEMSRFSRLLVLILVTFWAPALLYFSMPLLRILSSTLKINLYSDEFFTRIGLDLYPTFFGTIVGIMVHYRPMLLAKANDFPKSLLRFLPHFCILVLVIYTITLQLFEERADSNIYHRITSPIPILAYFFLRNSTSFLRDHYSAFFAWVGRHSLETYILQYHIWLAADTHGLLRLGLLPAWLETFLMTLLFGWGSVQVGNAVSILSKWYIEGGETTLETETIEMSNTTTEPNQEGSPSKEKPSPLLPQPSSTPTTRPRFPHDITHLIIERTARLTTTITTRIITKYPKVKRVQEVPQKWRDSLKVRLGILLVGMWICNWLYDAEDLQRLVGFNLVAFRRRWLTQT